MAETQRFRSLQRRNPEWLSRPGGPHPSGMPIPSTHRNVLSGSVFGDRYYQPADSAPPRPASSAYLLEPTLAAIRVAIRTRWGSLARFERGPPRSSAPRRRSAASARRVPIRTSWWERMVRSDRSATVSVLSMASTMPHPETSDPDSYPIGRGPQGDAIRIYTMVHLVR